MQGINNSPNGARPPVGRQPLDPESEKKKSAEYMMLFIEGIIFLIVLAICISIFSKIKKGNKTVDTSNDTAVEQTQEPSVVCS